MTSEGSGRSWESDPHPLVAGVRRANDIAEDTDIHARASLGRDRQMTRSSELGHVGDALAHGGDEGRGKLR